MKEKVITLTKRFAGHELISGSSYLFLGTTIGNILAFFLNIFLTNTLSYSMFAEFSVIVSLVTLSSIPAQAFLPTIVQFAGRYFAKKELPQAKELYKQASLKIGLLAMLICIGFAIFSTSIGSFFHMKNTFEILLAGAIIAGVYLNITNSAFLQSLLKFQFVSFTLVVGGIIKFIGGAGSVLLGLGLNGILWGYFLTFFIPFLISFIPLRFLYSYQKAKATIHAKEIFSYGLPAALAVFSLTSFTSTDILLVKHFFPNQIAASYSVLSLIGRIIFYFTAPISSVMFPLVIKRFHKGENTNSLLYMSFFLVLIPSVILTFIYFLFPNIIIRAFGKQYLSIAMYLGWFGIYLTIFSLLNVLVNFFLSIKKTNVSWVITLGAVCQVVGISLFHKNLLEVIGISLFLSLVLFIILLLYYMRLYETKKKSR